MSVDVKADRKVVVTCGTFDLFHIGHLNILKRAKDLGDILYVGVSSDSFTFGKKQKLPVYCEKDRMSIVGAIRYVDGVFLEEAMEEKANYLTVRKCNVFVIGDDWKGRFDFLKQEIGCEVVYLERTPDVSTTDTISMIQHNDK